MVDNTENIKISTMFGDFNGFKDLIQTAYSWLDLFREIVGSKSITRDKYNFTRDYNNINKILWKIPGANGVKTGYTGQAGKCLVSSINNNGKDIIIVVLNCPDRWNVTDKIYKHVMETVAFGNHNVKELI